MPWWAVDVRPSAPADTGSALAAWLIAQTGQAIEERDDGTLVTFAATERGARDLLAAIRRSPDPSAHAALRELEVVDWTTRWREGLGPRRFGRLVVVPSWVERPDPAAPTVVLDPEMAFGSGEHGSTRGALTLLERHLSPDDIVLDLGSGSGILAIAAIRLGAARATGVEVDPEANAVAGRNAERNGVARACRFLDGDAATLAPLLGPADLLLSNILRTVNVTLLPAIHAALRPGGVAIFSGMEAAEREAFLPDLVPAGLAPFDEVTDAGWWAVAARRLP